MRLYPYFCKYCGQVILRTQKVRWFISYCGRAGKDSRVYRIISTLNRKDPND